VVLTAMLPCVRSRRPGAPLRLGGGIVTGVAECHQVRRIVDVLRPCPLRVAVVHLETLPPLRGASCWRPATVLAGAPISLDDRTPDRGLQALVGRQPLEGEHDVLRRRESCDDLVKPAVELPAGLAERPQTAGCFRLRLAYAA